jgi:hypothetical protein
VFHDLGYPWQYAERLQSNLFGMNSPSITTNRSATQVFDEYEHRLLMHALRGYKKQDAASPSRWASEIVQLTDVALSQTHGFPGALGFLHLNDAIRKYPIREQSPLHLLCVEWVAVAIMMHDLGKIYWGKDRLGGESPTNPSLRLSFDRDPLSSIVTLADVLQEFNRPTAKFGQTNGIGLNDQVVISYESVCSETELELDGAAMTIRYKMKDDDSRRIKRKSIADDQHCYFDRASGFLNMESIGIESVKLEAV